MPEHFDLCLQLVKFLGLIFVVDQLVDRQSTGFFELLNHIISEGQTIILDQLFAIAISVLDLESIVQLYLGQVTHSKGESNNTLAT